MDKRLITSRQRRARRQIRVRTKVSGTAKHPRLNVYRSLTGIYAQLINDEKSQTLIAVHSKKIGKGEIGEYKGKEAVAYLVGKELAKQAQEKKIKKVVFDRAGYRYHGRVKALATGAREGGLEF